MLRIYEKFICEIKNPKTKNKIIIGEIIFEFFVSLAFNNIDIDIAIVINIRIVNDNIDISICDFKLNCCKLNNKNFNFPILHCIL